MTARSGQAFTLAAMTVQPPRGVTRRPRGLRGYAHTVGYKTFYRLPFRLRRRLVRMLTPTYTLGAVTIALDGEPGTPPPAARRILLLRQPPGFGWGLPGGLIERGEEPVRCAARELAEESGVRLSPDQLRPADPNALIHPAGRWVDTVFLAYLDPTAHDLIIDGAEVLEATWFPLTDLPRLTRPAARLLARYGIGPLTEAPPPTP
jgi:8-oxo-dGTP pyrophosphatase MutT (NUDIX family)